MKLFHSMLLLFIASCSSPITFPAPDLPCIPDTVYLATPDVDTVSSNSLIVGVTGGAEVHDHYTKINVPSHPLHWRAYYLQSKDHEYNTYPSEVNFKVAPKEYDSSLGWHVYENQNRFRSIAKLQKENPGSTLMISTENLYGPNGEYYGFPNKNWRFSHWGSQEKIIQWTKMFISNMNTALGEGNWIWQLSSEPWDVDWQQVQKGYIEGWLSFPASQRPQLATPALPIGQGSATETGTNQYFKGTLQDFVPAEYRKYYSYVCTHAYALDNHNNWVNDPSIPIAVIQKAVLFRNTYMPHAKVRVTETGYPATDQDIQYQHIKEILSYCEEEKALDAVYLYNYLQLPGGGVFDNCYIADTEKQPTKAYYLTTRKTVTPEPQVSYLQHNRTQPYNKGYRPLSVAQLDTVHHHRDYQEGIRASYHD